MRLLLSRNNWQNNFIFTYTTEYSIFPINEVVNTYFFPIPDSRFPIPLLGGVRGGFRFPIPDSRFPIPDSRFPIPDSRFPVPCSQCPNYDIHIKLS
ncbi:hypothetical protein [Moorena sp. SIO4G3]|uniref:hypothetical protein n=1 Tax=Moorena sp. SIO4G3 TaxID=2607821 RepID=UPI00142B1938|nr:hypothetical protein [Moorena sp. SIO4G3]NEO77969.1 hypothetical protein [Moorena sp. SIO4G3]